MSETKQQYEARRRLDRQTKQPKSTKQVRNADNRTTKEQAALDRWARRSYERDI